MKALLNNTDNNSHYTAVNTRLNSKQCIGKDMDKIMTSFRILSWHLLGGTEENHENIGTSSLQAKE
jgi:hypothetical protein